jgi:hypothetical protein
MNNCHIAHFLSQPDKALQKSVADDVGNRPRFFCAWKYFNFQAVSVASGGIENSRF